MKTFTTMTAAAMLIAGMSFANAQNAGGKTDTGTPSPSSLNASTIKGDNTQSGSETKGAAAMKKKGAKPMNAAQATTIDNSGPNNKPIDSGSAAKSGTQSKEAAMKGDQKGEEADDDGLWRSRGQTARRVERQAAPDQAVISIIRIS